MGNLNREVASGATSWASFLVDLQQHEILSIKREKEICVASTVRLILLD